MKSMLAWHWLNDDRRLRYGAREVVEVGKTYSANGPLVLCQNGVHGSRWPLDALQYATGSIVCRVRLHGEMQHTIDKSMARHRTVLWMADATRTLHEFALFCAHDALGFSEAMGEPVDARVWAVLDVKAKWLQGQASDQEVATAWAAARETARGAVRDAAWAAAGATAWAAARETAGAAAWIAVRVTAGAAAGAAARETQNIVLDQMLLGEHTKRPIYGRSICASGMRWSLGTFRGLRNDRSAD